MRRGARAALLAILFGAVSLGGPARAPAVVPAAPAWGVTSLATPTAFVPGDAAGDYSYDVRIANIGAAATNGTPITVVDTLPAGLEVKSVEMVLRSKLNGGKFDYGPFVCSTSKAGEVESVTCPISESIPEAREPAVVQPSEERRIVIHVSVPSGMEEGKQLSNRVEVHGGSAPVASIVADNQTASLDGEGHPLPAPGGISFFHSLLAEPDGSMTGQAASHPYEFITGFAVNTKPGRPGGEAAFVPAGGDLKDIRVALPPGLVGNPTAATRCTAQEFSTTHSVTPEGEGGTTGLFTANACPDGSAVGLVLVQQVEGTAGIVPVPLYNLVPPPGMPAQLGFQILNLPFFIDAEVRTGGDYGITSFAHNNSQVKRLTAASVIIWGTPADPSHNALRGSCLNELPEGFPVSLGNCPAGIPDRPFLRLPTGCESPLETQFAFDTWTTPRSFLSATSNSPAPSNCAPLAFSPSISAVPQTTVADSPSGLSFDLHLPQGEDPAALATADLRDLTVTLPEGVSVNPSSAAGLAACSPAQVDLHGPGPAQCPDASKVGSVEVRTPLLDHPVDGAVYVAAQNDNPFGSLLAIYVTAHDPQTGVVLKLAGKVEPDPRSGQLRTTFLNNPQLPFEDLQTVFFEGPRAPLRTPLTCGRYTTTTEMRPWSAPESGPDATPPDSFDVSTSPAGGRCAASEAAAPNRPSFQGGTVTPIAGSYSPFVLHLQREDGSQYLRRVGASLPPGLLGKLAGIPYCPDSALALAASRPGRSEQAAPSCPAASRVGGVDVAAGAGTSPIHVAGTAYLAGPYRGAPLSLAVITPAVAGPFDLGTVVVRTALHVDPRTARVSAVSDPLPTILQGIPLDVRSISLNMDRHDFMLNPTSCEPMLVRGEAITPANQVAPLSNRFQVGACGALGFAPRLGIRLSGPARRGAHPRLRAVLKPRAGDANVASAVVSLPHSEFLDQGHIRTVCTRVQFAAGGGEGAGCPAGSVYGHAVATTPLLDAPLKGPVYLRSSDHKLPDLVAALHGQIDVELSGRIDSVRGGIRTSFETVPDAPVSKFVLTMSGGRKGLLINSRNICSSANAAAARFVAQNGRATVLHPRLKSSSCAKGKISQVGESTRTISAPNGL